MIPFFNTIFQVYHARLYIHKSVKRIIKDIINVHNSFNLYISDVLCLKKTSHYPDTAYAVYLTFNINWVLFNTLFSIKLSGNDYACLGLIAAKMCKGRILNKVITPK